MKLKISATIAIYFILLVILVLNIDEKSKVIKNSFLLFVISLLVALFFVNELIMDYIISIIIRYFYFPSFASIILTLLIAMFVFIYSIFADHMRSKIRIINYVFASFIFVAYIVFMLLDIPLNSYNALYDGDSLLCLRYISRTFILWGIVILISKYFYFFLRKNESK